MKRLIVCCDGTWQNLSSKYPTNVVKVAQAITSKAKDRTPQIVFYDEGIGTGDKVDKLYGGVTGWGIDQNIQDAYRFLCLNYDRGDEIYLYGFSRGAYTVRSLAGLIYCSGLLERSKIRQAPQAYELYQDRNIHPDHPQAVQFREENAIHLDNNNPVPITLLACWDTVGALGIPDQIPWLHLDRWINKKYQFHDTTLSPIIQNARHAVAIDETRKIFDFTPMVKSSQNRHQSLRQVWFPGEHGCVGGGIKEQSGLSDGALQWMIDESKVLGLEFDESKIPDGIKPDSTIPFDNTSKGKRKVDCAALHSSVIERRSKVDNYRPKNLSDCFNSQAS